MFFRLVFKKNKKEINWVAVDLKCNYYVTAMFKVRCFIWLHVVLELRVLVVCMLLADVQLSGYSARDRGLEPERASWPCTDIVD